jgi:hypothetical protein
MKDTHPQVKFDVFERLNTGAVKLSAQELRHGIYHGRFINWLDKVGREKRWQTLTSGRSDKRMRAEEFLLRFLALHFRLDAYEKPLVTFLNSFAEDHRDANDAQLAEFESLVSQTVNGVAALFGELAFKVFDRTDNDRIVSPFNAALFDAEMLSVSRAQSDVAAFSERKRKRILDRVAELFLDETFLKAINLATSDAAQIRKRIDMIGHIIAANA